MPESLAEVHLEFPTGLRVVPGCAEDIVAVAVPAGTQLPAKPGCGFPQAGTTPENSNPIANLKERAEQFLKGLAALAPPLLTRAFRPRCRTL